MRSDQRHNNLQRCVARDLNPSSHLAPEVYAKTLTKHLVQCFVEPISLDSRHEVTVILFDLSQIGDKISLVRLDGLGFLDELPAEEDDGEEEYHHVARKRQLIVVCSRNEYLREEEVWNIPEAWQKHGIPTDKGHDECGYKGIVCSVWLQDTRVGQSIPIQALYLARLVETQERVAHDREVDELGGSHQADEPAEDDRRVLTQLQERQQRDSKDDSNAEIRNTLLSALGQDLGCLTLKRKTEERARCAVYVRVASREGGSKYSSVNNVGKNLNPQPVHGNNVRRSGSSGLTISEGSLQFRVVVWNVDANSQGTKDEESCETVEDGVVGTRHDLSGILGLSGSHGDVVRTSDRERGLDQALQKAKEATQIASVIQLGERSGVLPVPEPISVLLRVSSEHGDEGKDEETDDKQNLANGGPELSLTIPLHCH